MTPPHFVMTRPRFVMTTRRFVISRRASIITASAISARASLRTPSPVAAERFYRARTALLAHSEQSNQARASAIRCARIYDGSSEDVPRASPKPHVQRRAAATLSGGSSRILRPLAGAASWAAEGSAGEDQSHAGGTLRRRTGGGGSETRAAVAARAGRDDRDSGHEHDRRDPLTRGAGGFAKGDGQQIR